MVMRSLDLSLTDAAHFAPFQTQLPRRHAHFCGDKAGTSKWGLDYCCVVSLLIVELFSLAETMRYLNLGLTTEAQPAHHMDSGSASSSARTPPSISTVAMAEEDQLMAFQRTK